VSPSVTLNKASKERVMTTSNRFE